MTFSDDTINVINYLDVFSNYSLRKKQDVSVLLEVSASLNIADKFNQIIFLGKSIWNLYQTIRRSSNNGDISLVEKEILISFQEFQKNLEILSANFSPEIQNRFKSVYLQDTEGCFKNTIDLSHDLSIFKDIQIEELRKNKK